MKSIRSLTLKLKKTGGAKANSDDPELLGLLGFEAEGEPGVNSQPPLIKRPICVRQLRRDIKLVREHYKECRMCIRQCGVNRLENGRGACGNDANPHIYAAQVSYGEEKQISPTVDIFFTGCNLRCRDCHQQDQWPLVPGYPYLGKNDVLEYILKKKKDLRSISFLGGNPEQSLAGVLDTVLELEAADVGFPYVFNSNFLFSEEYCGIINKYFDIFIPDFKFGNDRCAATFSDCKKGYVEILKGNILSVQSTNPIFIRHRPRKGHWNCCTKPIIRWVAEHSQGRNYIFILLESLFDDNSRQMKNSAEFALSFGVPAQT